MSGRKSPIARARNGKRESPIARERENVQKNERRPSPNGKARVSPIARAREQKKKDSPKVASPKITKSLSVVDDAEDFPPLSVPFGLECYLSRAEIDKVTEYIKANKKTQFQIYTVDLDEANPQDEYESVLVYGWFRPAAGVNIKDIWDNFTEKESEWHKLLWVAGLMPEGTVMEEIRFPEMLDPVEEEDEDM
jgi:hypothetical protein